MNRTFSSTAVHRQVYLRDCFITVDVIVGVMSDVTTTYIYCNTGYIPQVTVCGFMIASFVIPIGAKQAVQAITIASSNVSQYLSWFHMCQFTNSFALSVSYRTEISKHISPCSILNLLYFDGLVHDWINSSVLEMELLKSCTPPSISYFNTPS